jgi:hypothetical protein
MSRFLGRRKAAVSAGVAVVVLIAAGGAYAYWTNGGSGSGSAATGTNVAITVTQTSTPTALYPGGPTAGLAGAFNNGNASPVRVHQVSATISSVTRTALAIAGSLPCAVGDYQINGFPLTVDAQVPAGSGQGSWTGASIQLLDTGVNQDGCKGATVNLAYTSN